MTLTRELAPQGAGDRRREKRQPIRLADIAQFTGGGLDDAPASSEDHDRSAPREDFETAAPPPGGLRAAEVEGAKFAGEHAGPTTADAVVLDNVAAASMANGAAVNQWGCGQGTHQQWRLKSVESGPMKPDVTFDVEDILHGQPGYVNFSGKVHAAAYPVEKVNIVFEKEVSANNWQTLSEINNLQLNGEGSFKIWYHGLSSGNWRGRAVFNSTSPYLANNFSSEDFVVKRGYQLKNRYSEKCMSLSENKYNNGQAIIQWSCSSSPQPGGGQVFTFVPVDFGYFNLKINHSSHNKCVDVSGVSHNNGAWLHAWDCLGGSQHNQVWQKIPIDGQEPWKALRAKHSSKCADVTGPSPNNGVRIQQWDCLWYGNQQWRLDGVE